MAKDFSTWLDVAKRRWCLLWGGRVEGMLRRDVKYASSGLS
eukprot:CAMPEP_0197564440 /NCGR_PEP_ID=MMETSP1320-20131121/30415_1 /TAXON_ID=91990 /ORGANISM="Bolidomonas sp., Strain RCC2347" /LENGTH=40 /DNA_ID= /DNA_START= /DNA_END= /DNA_ORIENTATION=